MEISYWQSRWRNQKTGWHMDTVFPLLKEYWPTVAPVTGTTVLVPLCGKSLDIDWLIRRGHYVIGADVSEIAINAIIKRRPESCKQSTEGAFTCFRSSSFELWCGNIFKLKSQWLPPIDVVYDKAALIALPPERHARYTQRIQSLIPSQAQMLLNTFEYHQDEMNGPPFAVFKNELQSLLGDHYIINLLHERNLFNELTKFHRRGLQSYLREKLYHLQPR